MSFLIIVADEPQNNQWEIIDNIFPEPPEPVVEYVSLTKFGHVPVIDDLGPIAIRNANTGAEGTGNLIEI